MKVELREDGSAFVSSVPLSPFTGYQHGRIDILTAARLSGFMRRLAFEYGWLQPSDPDEAANATGFFVACDTRLDNRISAFISTRAMCDGQLFVTNVGTSSFSLTVILRALEESGGNEPLLICRMGLTYVSVSRTTRRPVAVPPTKRLALELSYKLSAALREEHQVGGGLERLQFSDPRIAHVLQLSPPSLVSSLEASADENVCYERRFELREQDMDLNNHLNQSMYQSLALDTLKAACRPVQSGASRFAWIVAAAAAVQTASFNPLHADLVVSGLRIDYKKEVPLSALGTPGGVITVRLAPDEATRSIWFAVWALDSSDIPSPFQAALGVLTIR